MSGASASFVFYAALQTHGQRHIRNSKIIIVIKCSSILLTCAWTTAAELAAPKSKGRSEKRAARRDFQHRKITPQILVHPATHVTHRMEKRRAAARTACGTVSILLVCWAQELSESLAAQPGRGMAISAKEKAAEVGVSSFYHPQRCSVKGTAAPFSEISKIISKAHRMAFTAG